ncbi:MAG: NCS2 family permease, partial [Proteobacteria bacterium]|nr:NCS2 family permease [Pseudomonadota bacterium]MBU1611840.1 NCS2 family permease [Pseudomonadota bacterium]
MVAGLTTFVTMAYIIIVNPKMLEAAGIPFGPSMVATILSAFFGTLAMGLYAKRPFAVAPYMGENAFVAYTVCGLLGYSWQTALGAIFISGILFVVITLLGVRQWLVKAIPLSLKMGFIMGIGLFLTFIGLMDTGIVVKPEFGPVPVMLGNMGDLNVLLALSGLLIMSVLLAWRVPGAIIIGILGITIATWALGVSPLPEQIFSSPPSMNESFLAMDVSGALVWGIFSVILTVFVMDFVDTMGTIYAIGHQAGFLDEYGDMPDIKRPLLVDALATVVAACLGTTSTGVYIESATGIQAGGRTGLTSVVTALFFLLALFLSPLFISIPACAYGPSLIVVGMLMMSSVSRMDFGHISETLP